MRCDCCNKRLSNYEATLRHAVTREFLNTCLACLDGLDIPTTGRPDVPPDTDLENDDDEYLG